MLAWQGWPETSAMFWGVVTRVTDGQLEGVTLWAEGRPRRLVAPALQCYVVETCNPVPPPRDRLLTMALQHADAYLNHAPFASGVANAAAPGIVTGPAAYDAWEAWLETGAFSASEADTGWREHRQHAEFMTTSRQSAIAFVSSIREIVPASQQLQVDAIIDACSQELNHLLPSCDEQVVCRAFATPAGRRTLLDALHRAEAASRRIASTIEEFTTVYQTVERPI